MNDLATHPGLSVNLERPRCDRIDDRIVLMLGAATSALYQCLLVVR